VSNMTFNSGSIGGSANAFSGGDSSTGNANVNLRNLGNGATLVELFRQALDNAPEGSVVHTEVAESMGLAITLARKYATAGDIVLLSPGAPSFGQYQDYQARADDFRHAIESTTPKENP
jgi:UDP-N-acetylmuramoylalanine-D-glutamate ligase